MMQEKLKLLDGDTPAYPPYHDDDDNQNESEGAELWARPKRESATRPEESNTYVGAQVNPPKRSRMVSFRWTDYQPGL